MNLILSLAFRNLARNLRRTVITSVAVVVGTALLVMSQGLIAGLDENVIRAQEDAVSGNVRLRPEDYPTDELELHLDKATQLSQGLVQRLGDDRVESWAPRLWFSGRVIAGADGVRVKIIGFDPIRDPQVFPREGWTFDGQWPAAADQVVLSQQLADLLKVKVGDMVVLEARTRAGAINALQFNVSGLLRTGNMSVDFGTVWLPLDTVDSLALTEGARSEVAVRLKSGRRGADDAAGWLSGDAWIAHTATYDVADILAINDIRRRGMGFLVFILMAIAATGIANTVIMATYERVREIGTLRAMGMSQGGIRALFLLEGALMGATAGLVGSAIGAATVIYYSIHGIDLSKTAAADAGASMPMSMMLYTQFHWEVAVFALAFGAVIAVLSSLYPAQYAAGLNPADAVRAD